MKILHIPAKSIVTVDLSHIKSKIKGKILLFTTVQYIDQIAEIRKQLGLENCDVIKPNDSHAKYPGQLLGCTKLSKEDISGYDAILFVGDGLFHPIALSNEDIDVYCYNPKSYQLQKLEESYFNNIKKRKKLGLNTFYRSKKIGVLISTKPGQKRPDAIDVLKKYYPDKDFFALLFDTIDFSRLSDFNFIECFVNTACPRIAIDDEFSIPCINISDLEELKYKW